MGLRTERVYPYSLGLATAVVYLLAFRNRELPGGISSLFEASISIASIAVGFFATAKTAVVQLESSRPLIQKLRQAQRYDVFLGYMSVAIYVSFAFAALSALALLVDFVPLDWKGRLVFTVWLSIAVLATSAYFRVVQVLNVILDSPPND